MARADPVAPLEDPAYEPLNPPVNGLPPDVVAKWGPRSQHRWFVRYQGQIKPMKYSEWDRFYCDSDDHLGLCCSSCISDIEEGYQDWDEDRCCCRAPLDWEPGGR
jgi:hypothetical protein